MTIILLLQLFASPSLDSARAAYLQGRDVWQGNHKRVMCDSLVGWISRPSLDVQFNNREFHTRVTTDGAGFRRSTGFGGGLVLIGDSFVFGWGVNDHETAASWLGAYNVSCPGWNTHQQLAAAIRWANKNDPMRRLTYVLVFNETDSRENEWLNGTPTFKSCEQFDDFVKFMSSKDINWWDKIQLSIKYWRPSAPNPIPRMRKEFPGSFVITLPTLKEVEAAGGRTVMFGVDDYYPLDGHLNAKGQKWLSEYIRQIVNSEKRQ